MVTDSGEIAYNLTKFFDFEGKVVVHADLRGGAILGYAAFARRVVLLDREPAEVVRMRRSVAAAGVDDRFVIACGDLPSFEPCGDVVLLDFCLHSETDPGATLARAWAIAGDVLVMEHAPGSEWADIAGISSALDSAWNAVEAFRVRRQMTFQGFQIFRDRAELCLALARSGVQRADSVAARWPPGEIVVRMPYRIVLI